MTGRDCLLSGSLAPSRVISRGLVAILAGLRRTLASAAELKVSKSGPLRASMCMGKLMPLHSR